MIKLSRSLHEYLCSLKNMHIFNNIENDDWGFFVDIEPKINANKITEKKYRYHFKPSFNNRIHSHKSVSNLDQLTNIYEPIFKMDEDYEEENEKKKEYNNSSTLEKINLIGNICVVSSIILFIFLI